MGASLLARQVASAGGVSLAQLALGGPAAEEAMHAFIAQVGPERAFQLSRMWRAIARPEQLMPGSSDAAIARPHWRTWLLMAGRGFGKTRTGAETVIDLVDDYRARAIALIAPNYRAARRLMIEHPVSGILARSTPGNVPDWNKGDGELRWPSGAIGYVYTAEEPEGLRGFNGDLAWLEEVGSWQYPNETWANLQLGLRIPGPRGDRARALITTTPRPIELIRKLVVDPNTVVTGGSTYDNAANLDPAALQAFLEMFEGTRLGDQELYAKLLGDTPGALWSLALLDANRVVNVPTELRRVVIAVDPAVKDTSTTAADADLDERAFMAASETGIIVAGLADCKCRGSQELHGFVLADASGIYSPRGWAEKVAELYREWGADLVVAEINQGGALVESNIKTLGDSRIVYKGVHAAKGKQTRAEPIASLDEKGKIHHVGAFGYLEDQMCHWQPLRSKKSPDRMDARVWAFTELMLGDMEVPYESWAGLVPRRQ